MVMAMNCRVMVRRVFMGVRILISGAWKISINI
jgi:hypothetical protein